MDVRDSLAQTGKDLVIKETFYGLLLLTIARVVKSDIPTAGVSLNGLDINLTVNPTFWENLTRDHRLGVLKHELLHIAMYHLFMRNGFPDKKLFNIAADLEINQYIKRENLPGGEFTKAEYEQKYNPLIKSIREGVEKGTMTREEAEAAFSEIPMRCIFLEDYGFEGEEKKGTAYYYKKLQQKKGTGECPNLDQMYSDMSNGVPTVCDHGSWDGTENLSEATRDLIKSQLQGNMKNVAEQIINSSKNRGTIPGELRSIIDELLEETDPVIDWRAFFRRFAGNAIHTNTRKTRRKPSVRFPDQPSIKIIPKKHILFAIDTSGSMSSKDLQECFTELNHVKKSGVAITVIECDAQIGRVYPYTNIESIGNVISGGGGTDFQPVIDYYNENRNIYSTLIYFTDGYAPNPQNPPPLKSIMWVVSTNGLAVENLEEQNFPGTKVQMNVDWE